MQEKGGVILAKYVKFLRGTPKAYENLPQKDSDTLYFIYEQDEANGLLYLGSKLIAGANSGEENPTNINSLKDLKDVLLTELVEDSFLVYDSSASAWVNKRLEELIFIGATEDTPGLAGLVPAPDTARMDLFLQSDGTWAKPSINHTILTIENKDKSNHNALIADGIGNINPISGDIVIIKDLIAEQKWQYTAYVFDNGMWQAMDGNYDAENVYFSEDLITTVNVGNIELSGGKAIIPSSGKNLKEVFEAIFVKEETPEIESPSIILTFSNAKDYEVGTEVEPSYIVTFNKGKYEFGPDTAISVEEWEITDSNGNILSTEKGTFDTFTVADDTDYSITATANYNDGAMPLTNLGNDCPETQILKSSISAMKDGLKGYRKTFYGTFENKDELTSDLIRSLYSTNKALSNGSVVSVNIPEGAKRIVFAYPAELNDLSSVTDTNAFGTEILSGFTKILLDVEGNNHYQAKSYKVYYLDYARSNNVNNSYTFTIKEEG